MARRGRRNDTDGGTTRTAARRGRRNDADDGTTRTKERRGRRNDADGGTTRAAERRGRRNDVGGGATRRGANPMLDASVCRTDARKVHPGNGRSAIRFYERALVNRPCVTAQRGAARRA